jgi:hypothetical protein
MDAGPLARPATVSPGLEAYLDTATLRPTLGVAALILAVFFGVQLVNAAVPAGGRTGVGPGPGVERTPDPAAPTPFQPTQPPVGPGPAQPGETLTIGPLRLSLPSGWQTGQTQSGNFRMGKGGVIIDLNTLVLDQDADATGLCAAFINQVLAPDATGFSTSQPVPFAVTGASAARALYSGVFGQAGEVEGQVTVIVVGRQAVFFDAWSGPGMLRALLPEIERIFETAQVVG